MSRCLLIGAILIMYLALKLIKLTINIHKLKINRHNSNQNTIIRVKVVHWLSVVCLWMRVLFYFSFLCLHMYACAFESNCAHCNSNISIDRFRLMCASAPSCLVQQPIMCAVRVRCKGDIAIRSPGSAGSSAPWRSSWVLWRADEVGEASQ